MTHPLTPREKVAGIVLDAAAAYLIQQYGASHGLDHEIDRARIVSAIPNDAILTALASGSGDHAELARLADDLRKFEHHAVGSLKIDMGEARRIIDVCDAHIDLLAENAALRASVVKANDGFEEYERRFYLEQERATEAERKLAEAVELLRDWMGTWFVDADSRGENAIADDTRKFLSKEAERG